MNAARSYRDVLARSTRLRPDGSPVWPLTDADLPSRFAPFSPTLATERPQLNAEVPHG